MRLKCHHCGIRLYHFNLQQICNYSHIQVSFQDFLLSIGEGGTGNYVEIPDSMVATGNSIEGLIYDIFGDGRSFDKRVIRIVKNDDAQMMNSKVLNLVSGDAYHGFSADLLMKKKLALIQLNSKIHYNFQAFLHMILNLKMDS